MTVEVGQKWKADNKIFKNGKFIIKVVEITEITRKREKQYIHFKILSGSPFKKGKCELNTFLHTYRQIEE